MKIPFIKKKNINKSDKSELLYNSPVEDLDFYSKEVEYLNEGVKNPTCKNIGVIGTYGSGKSSLIKTFVNKFFIKKIKHISYISLAKFSEGHITEYSEREIEKSILEQLFFKVSLNKLTRSNIKKIDRRFELRLIVILVLSFLFLISFLYFCFLFIGKNDNYISYLFSNVSEFLIKIFFPIIIVLFLLFSIIYLTIRNMKFSRISFKGIELSINNDKDSLIDIYIDEILYYFEKTKTKILVVEDLDRFDSKFIFQKLRELNLFLNNSDRIKDKITFIYCIKEDVFKTEEQKSKFFDLTITIVPYLNNRNCADIILKKLEDYDIRFLISNTDAYFISQFIKNYRTLNGIINDFIIYSKKIDIYKHTDAQKNIILFTLMTYKNLFPKGFVEFEKGLGNGVEIINEIKNVYSELINKKKDELDKEYKNNGLNNSVDYAFIRVRDMIVGRLYLVKKTNEVSFPSTDIEKINNIDELLNTENYKVRCSNYYNNYYYLTKSEFETFYKKTIKSIYNDILLSNANELSALENNYASIINEISNLSGVMIDKILVDNEDIYQKMLNKYQNDKEALFLIFCFKNRYIPEDYLGFLFNANDILLSNYDNNLLQKIILGLSIDYDTKINNPKLLCSMLNEKYFNKNVCLNYSIVNTMFNANEDYLKSKKKLLITLLSSNNNQTNDFLINYVRVTNDINSLFNNLTFHECPYVETLLNSQLTDIEKELIIVNLLKREIAEIKEADTNYCVSNYISSRKDSFYFIYNSLLKDDRKTINIIKYLNVNFENLEFDKNYFEQTKNIINFIIKENKYKVCSKNVNFLLSCIGLFDESNENILTNLLDTYKGEYSNYFTNRYVEFVTWEAGQESFVENDKFIYKVLNRSDIDLNILKKFIKNMINKLEDVTCINNPDLVKYCFQVDKIKATWFNLYNFYVKNHNNVDACLKDFIVNNIHELGVLSLNIDTNDFARKILFYTGFKDNFEVFKKLVDYIKNIKISDYSILTNISSDELIYMLDTKMHQV